MTRKHFEAIAEVIRSNRERSSAAELFRMNTLALELADVLCTFNPNFDSDRFLTACGRI